MNQNPYCNQIYTGNKFYKYNFLYRKAGVFLFSVFLLIMLIFYSPAELKGAEPSLFTENPIKFDLSSSTNADKPLTFLLFSKDGNLTDATVTLKAVKNSQGQNLPSNAAGVSLSSTEILSNGITVSIVPTPSFFQMPGEYQLTLLFEGKAVGGKSITLVSTVTLILPSAVINTDELKDQSIQLIRDFPFCSVSRSIILPLRETSGKRTLQDVKVIGQNIYQKDTKTLVPGIIKASSFSETEPIEVTFSGLKNAGEFNTNLVIQSKSLSSEQILPLKLFVTDFWLYPLLVILVGVIIGASVRRYSNNVRPQQVNKLQILMLRGEIKQYLSTVTEAQKLETVRSMWRTLRKAEEDNELNDTAGAVTLLNQVEAALEIFRGAEVKLKAETRATLSNYRIESELFAQNFAPFSAEEKTGLSSISDKLDAIETLLKQNRIDSAAEKLLTARKNLDNLKQERVVRQLKELKLELSGLGPLDEAAEKKVAELEKKTNEQINDKNFDDARLTLNELNNVIDESRKSNQPRSAREGFIRRNAALGSAAVNSSVRFINILTDLNQRLPLQSISFKIDGNDPLIDQVEIWEWSFGDNSEEEQTEKTEAIHTYNESGEYRVEAKGFNKTGAVITTLSEEIIILMSDIELQRSAIIKGIKSRDVMIFTIALIVASISGLLFLYTGKPFGTLQDYLLVLLWGFGVDNTVSSVSSVFDKTSTGK